MSKVRCKLITLHGGPYHGLIEPVMLCHGMPNMIGLPDTSWVCRHFYEIIHKWGVYRGVYLGTEPIEERMN